MRAVVFSSFGGPEVLRVTQLPTPEPGPGQLRIRVAAATVNPVDLAARAGAFGPGLPPGEYVAGWDVAGTVDAVGPGVSRFATGDLVAGLSQWFHGHVGTHAEYVVLAEESVAAVPEGLSAVQAATVPLNALTATQVLDLAGLSEGRSFAVTGAAGAVGGYAVQLAALRGLHVVALAGAEDEQLVRDLGAETFVPRSDDPAGALRAATPSGVDGAVDPANLGAPAIAAVRDGGVFVAVTGHGAPPAERDIQVHTMLVRPDGAALDGLLRLAASGRLAVRVAQTYPFEQAAQAHARMAGGGVRGRLVLVP
ncbi:MAG: NADP-dependent oxidoreductase [Micromonosporaceae bacterium]|nr:NADP-dependent oxidoreductase [Micromonosporaceae bacterium]